jgi:hypothetical protein
VATKPHQDTLFAQAADDDWVPNATFPKRPPALGHPLPMEAWIDHGIRRRRTISFIGDHGTGKTSRAKQYIRELGLAEVYVNLANITPDDKLCVAPVRTPEGDLALRQLIMEDLLPGQPFAILLDDANHALPKVKNQFMQVTNEWTIGNMPELEGLTAVIMLDNEGAAEGIRHQEDLAVADRKVTVRLHANDTGWRYALADKYRDVDLSEVFAVWDSLSKDLRFVLSPRTLDHVLYCVLNGFSPLHGLPIIAGQRVRLATTVDGRTDDRTEEVLSKICSALGKPYRTEVPDLARKAIKAALTDRLAILIEGPPGCGKTALTKDMVTKTGLRPVYYSMPFTDPEALIAPMPSKDGTLKALLASELTSDDPYAIIWDEYNRPSSPAAFAKLMEITQQWSLGGIDLDGCRAQIALCNPPEWQGRRMQVARNNIAQADRFTISIQVTPDDIPANEWLLNVWPDTVSDGNPATRERARSVIETVLEWWKSDLGDEQRQWITKRTLVRLAELHLDGLPLENGKIYLGDGEFAPVPLIDLEARLANRPMARLTEIVRDLDTWLERMEVAESNPAVGLHDVDQVHQALSLSELSQLWDHFEAVCELTKRLPAKLKGTFFANTSQEHQKLWIAVMTVVGGTKTAKQILKERAARTGA